MTINPAPDLDAFHAELWIGSLLVATGERWAPNS
jgi:hypothetical protein